MKTLVALAMILVAACQLPYTPLPEELLPHTPLFGPCP